MSAMRLPALPDGFAVRLAACLAVVGIGLLISMIVVFALPAFTRPGTGGVFTWSWSPYGGEYGILPMLVGSLLLAVSALLLAWPVAFLVCVHVLSRPGKAFSTAIQALVRLMTAVPTVVYGFAALFLLTPLVRGGLGGSGLCWLSAALMLALLVLPTMVLVLEAGLRPRLERLCPGGLAMGFDRLDLIWFFVLPDARKTITASLLLGFGRAAGDTLLPLMLAGNAPQVPQALGESLRTLTAHMALVTANEVGGAAYNSLFAAGALLLGVNMAVSLVLRRLRANGAAP